MKNAVATDKWKWTQRACQHTHEKVSVRTKSSRAGEGFIDLVQIKVVYPHNIIKLQTVRKNEMVSMNNTL